MIALKIQFVFVLKCMAITHRTVSCRIQCASEVTWSLSLKDLSFFDNSITCSRAISTKNDIHTCNKHSHNQWTEPLFIFRFYNNWPADDSPALDGQTQRTCRRDLWGIAICRRAWDATGNSRRVLCHLSCSCCSNCHDTNTVRLQAQCSLWQPGSSSSPTVKRPARNTTMQLLAGVYSIRYVVSRCSTETHTQV